MAYSFIRYVDVDGATTDFTFDFEYIAEAYIKVYVDGVLSTKWSLLNANEIRFDKAPAAGTTIVIERSSSIKALIATFNQTGTLSRSVLNNVLKQLLHLSQETYDKAYETIRVGNGGRWDGQNRIISGVSDPVDNQDVATKAFGEKNWGGESAKAAEASRLAAEVAQTNAELAQTNAETSSVKANTAKTSSETARDLAQVYRNEAQTAARNTFSTFVYTAKGGETSLSGPDDNNNTLAYVPNVLLVDMNGAILEDGQDFKAITGTSLTELDALSKDDVVTIRAFGSFKVTDHETKTTGVHGVVGAFVGTENVQTLLNKTLQNTLLKGHTMYKGNVEVQDGNHLMLRPSGNMWDYRLKAEGTSAALYSGGDLSTPVWKAQADKSMQFNGRIDADAGLTISNDAMFDKQGQNYLYYTDALQVAKSGSGPALDFDSSRTAIFHNHIKLNKNRIFQAHDGTAHMQLQNMHNDMWFKSANNAVYDADVHVFRNQASTKNHFEIHPNGHVHIPMYANTEGVKVSGQSGVTDMTPFISYMDGKERFRVRHSAAETRMQMVANAGLPSNIVNDNSNRLRFGTSNRSVDFVLDAGNVHLCNTLAIPTGPAPWGGGSLYVNGGALYWRGSSGTVTLIANA